MPETMLRHVCQIPANINDMKSVQHSICQHLPDKYRCEVLFCQQISWHRRAAQTSSSEACWPYRGLSGLPWEALPPLGPFVVSSWALHLGWAFQGWLSALRSHLKLKVCPAKLLGHVSWKQAVSCMSVICKRCSFTSCCTAWKPFGLFFIMATEISKKQLCLHIYIYICVYI